jgi:hypothetical protein
MDAVIANRTVYDNAPCGLANYGLSSVSTDLNAPANKVSGAPI